jgi:hypothetical protein
VNPKVNEHPEKFIDLNKFGVDDTEWEHASIGRLEPVQMRLEYEGFENTGATSFISTPYFELT